jgi:hypothetical protein
MRSSSAPGSPEALDVRERRAVHVQDAVELDLRLQRIEPALLVPRPESISPALLRDVRRSSGGSRSQRSPLPRIHVVCGSPRRRSIVSSGHGLPRGEVAAEQVRVGARQPRHPSDLLERNQIAVDVVQNASTKL